MIDAWWWKWTISNAAVTPIVAIESSGVTCSRTKPARSRPTSSTISAPAVSEMNGESPTQSMCGP